MSTSKEFHMSGLLRRLWLASPALTLVGILMIVAALASLIPAVRALRIDPSHALRAE